MSASMPSTVRTGFAQRAGDDYVVTLDLRSAQITRRFSTYEEAVRFFRSRNDPGSIKSPKGAVITWRT